MGREDIRQGNGSGAHMAQAVDDGGDGGSEMRKMPMGRFDICWESTPAGVTACGVDGANSDKLSSAGLCS